MIYLDNAATSVARPREVIDAVTSAMTSFGGVGRGVHHASVDAGMAVFEARDAISELLGGPGADRVSFAPNATVALNIAIEGSLPPGGIAVTTQASHNSVLRPLFKARDERGCSVRVVPHDACGSLDWKAFENAVEGADAVVLTHASNLTGDIFDVKRACALAHAAEARIIVDAAQTAGSVPVDMADLGADVLCFTGHKGLLGPQGTGGLIVREGVEIVPLFEGGSGTHSFDERHPRLMPEALEAGTINAHGIAGLGAGVRYLLERGVANVAADEARLRARFVEALSDLPRVVIYGGGGIGACGIVAFNVGDADSAFIADQMSSRWDICTRAGAHCAPLMHQALGTSNQGAVRVSFGPFSTLEEADYASDAVRRIVDELL